MAARRTKSTRILVVVALLAALLVAGRPGPAAAQAQAQGARAPRTTPELLEDATRRGELDPETADLHLARIFAGPGPGRGAGEVPARFRSTAPWHGTVPLFKLRKRLEARPPSAAKTEALAALEAATTCSDSTGSLPNETTSTHFYVSYGTIGGGLTVTSYLSSLEAAWTKEVTSFGWAAPPSLATPPPAPIGAKYPVRVDTLEAGLYGFASTQGTGAGFVGNNPNTPWAEPDAYASCLVLTRDYTDFPGTAQQALDATTAHEFNHAIQFGYGVGVFDASDFSMTEGVATWMEDEAADSANDSHNYLWPDFRDSMGEYDGSPYEFWFMLRGLTERFGTGVAGGGEQVMQDYWETASKGLAVHLGAVAVGLGNKGVTLPDAYHDFAVAAGFVKPCGGGYVLPYCFEEAAGYVATAGGLPGVAGSIGAVGGSFSGTLEDDYSLAWVTLPASPGYSLTLANTSSGGQLRATAVCDTGSALVRSPFPTVVGAGASTTLPSFSAGSCTRRLAVVTNQQQSPGNPFNPPVRNFTLSTAAAATPGGRYTPLAPARILDTRTGTGGIGSAVGSGGTVNVQITGQGGVPAAGVSAVAMNVTVTQPTAAGYLTLYPSGDPQPLAANLTFVPNQTIPNLVVVKVGAGGRVALFNSAGNSHVVFDVAGWYSNVPAGNDGRYQPLDPARILDTRNGTGGGVRLGPGGSLDLQVGGRGGVPASGAGAAVLNVAVTGTTAPSFLTVFPTGQPFPLAANLTYAGGDTVSNRVMAKLGTGGKITVYNNAGSTDVIVDVNGWYTDASVAGTSGVYNALVPARILDTRDGTGGIFGARAANSTVDVQITGRGGVPASGVGAVILNATVTGTTGPGYLSLFPAGTAQPLVSDLNYNPGETRPNLVVVKVGAGGKVSLYTLAGTHVVFDVAGWFATS